MKRVLLVLLLLGLILFVACSESPERGPWVEVVDGVEHVHNPETPLYPRRTVVFEEELTIRSEDGQGNVRLFRPAWYLVDHKGNIYISDLQDMNIKVFDPQGRLIRSIGRKGEGPGEFQNIGEIALLPDDRLLVLDWEAHRVSLFDRECRFLSSHKFINWSYDVFLTTDTFYVRDERIFGERTKLLVKAVDLSGRELFSYGSFEPHHSYEIRESRRWFTRPYDVRSILAGDQKNARLYHCLNDQYLIEVYDRTGRLFRKIDRPYKPLPTSEEDKKRYVEGFTGSSEKDRALIDKHVPMPPVKTVTDRMLVDDQGNLWVETNEERMDEGKSYVAYDIFDEDGFYAARVWLDISPGIFRNGKMVTRVTDEETGYRVFKRYRVVWTESTTHSSKDSSEFSWYNRR